MAQHDQGGKRYRRNLCCCPTGWLDLYTRSNERVSQVPNHEEMGVETGTAQVFVQPSLSHW